MIVIQTIIYIQKGIDRSINRRQQVLKAWGEQVVKQKIQEFEKQISEGKYIKNEDMIKSILWDRKQNNMGDSGYFSQVSDLFGEFLGMFFAGTDTTSNFINMKIRQVARHPKVEKKLREEIKAHMQEDDYSFENLKNFKYVDGVLKQVTRTYGPVHNIAPRIAVNNNSINGLSIKKGTIININTFPISHSDKYYQNPFELLPERWLNGECQNLPQYVSSVGFGGGARSCLSKHFALIKSKIVFIKFMKRYKKIKILNPNFKLSMK